MREVEAGDVHAGINQSAEGFLTPAGGAHGAHDLGLPDCQLGLKEVGL